MTSTCISFRLDRDQQDGHVLYMTENPSRPAIGSTVHLPPRTTPDCPGGLYRVVDYAPDFYSERSDTLYIDVYVEEAQ